MTIVIDQHAAAAAGMLDCLDHDFTLVCSQHDGHGKNIWSQATHTAVIRTAALMNTHRGAWFKKMT